MPGVMEDHVVYIQRDDSKPFTDLRIVVAKAPCNSSREELGLRITQCEITDDDLSKTLEFGMRILSAELTKCCTAIADLDEVKGDKASRQSIAWWDHQSDVMRQQYDEFQEEVKQAKMGGQARMKTDLILIVRKRWDWEEWRYMLKEGEEDGVAREQE